MLIIKKTLSNMLKSDEDAGDDFRLEDDQNTKKVRFKDGLGGEDVTMVVDLLPSLKLLSKDKLLGKDSLILIVMCLISTLKVTLSC